MQGYKPQDLKPFWPYLRGNFCLISFSRWATFLTVTWFSGFWLVHSFLLVFQNPFNGLKRTTSQGCKMWVAFEGKQINSISFSKKISDINMFIWLRFPSKCKTTRIFLFLVFSSGMNWGIYQKQNASTVIHPFLVMETPNPGDNLSSVIHFWSRS